MMRKSTVNIMKNQPEEDSAYKVLEEKDVNE